MKRLIPSIWVRALLSILVLCTGSANAWCAAAGFHHESEAGVVIASGNADSQSYNFKQLTTYGWELNLVKFNGKYLSTSSAGTETARSWNLGLRYERELANQFSVFVGQNVESDIFSGVVQRYNTDAGGKIYLIKEESLEWNVEGGYRLTLENRLTGQVTQHYLRVYTEANRSWTKTFSTKANLEYLPNLTVTSDYQLNAEVAANAALNEIFAIKVGYLVKYRNVPVAPATHTTDTQFTTALVAKM